jgi:hypothetical protein
MSQPKYLSSRTIHERPGRRRRRLAALLVATLPVLTLPVLASTSADAVLSGGTVGPVSPETSYPAFYTDQNGLSLQMCLDGSAACALTTVNDLLGGDQEAFYLVATAEAGGFSAEYALEGAGAGISSLVFARTRYRGDAVDGSEFTFTGPFRTDSAVAEGGEVRFVDDEGSGFDGVLGAVGMGPFLTWDTLGQEADAPPAGYVGDPDVLHAITGSPTGFNKFRVEGPTIDGTCVDGATVIQNCAETDQFSVMGKIAEGASAAASPNAVDFGPVTGSALQTISYKSIGTTAVDVTSVTSDNPRFVVSNDGCSGATLAAGGTCTVDVTYNAVVGASDTGALTFADSAGNHVVPLSGSGAQSGFNAMEDFDFGSVGVGRAATHDVAVTNNGHAPLALSSMTASNAAAGYSVGAASLNPCRAGLTTLAPGASCNARITFRPKAVGARNSSVSFGAGDQASASLLVVGNGRDVTRPAVAGRTPAAGATAASRTGNVTVRFSEAVKGVRSTTFKLTSLSSGARRAASITHSGNRWVLNPTATLPGGTRFRVSLVGGASAIRDSHDVTLRSTSWTFRTRR